MAMIYDCFTFFNELELLELRLNELADVVDKFVLVEATQTHTNKPKPLHYLENRARFSDVPRQNHPRHRGRPAAVVRPPMDTGKFPAQLHRARLDGLPAGRFCAGVRSG